MQKIKVEKAFSFVEARKVVTAPMQPACTTTAVIHSGLNKTGPSNKASKAVQTDLAWPLSSATPVALAEIGTQTSDTEALLQQ